MVKRASTSSRPTARTSAAEPAARTGERCVYYSPAGGRLLSVLENPAGDAKYERELDRTGTAWEKATMDAADTPEPGAALSGYRFVRWTEDGEQKQAVEELPT